MLSALSIRDIVLIDKLDLVLEPGLTVLTGETGAGKSILLDSLGLALGARGDSSLVRAGADKGVVTASFTLPPGHAALRLLEAQDIAIEGDLVIRRIQGVDGKSRASINDQPVSLNLLRQMAGLLTEIHGQHDDRALVASDGHRRLLDAFGGLEGQVGQVSTLWTAVTTARNALATRRERLEKAAADREFLEHAAEELRALGPVEGEEAALAETRQLMMNAEQFASALDDADGALAGDGAVEARISAALRKLERRKPEAQGLLDAACEALDRVVREMSEARNAIGEAQRSFRFDARELEQAEERLFALRAAARKHKTTVEGLPALLAQMEADLAAITDGGHDVARLEAAEAQAWKDYEAAALALSALRTETAAALSQAIARELAPLKLEKARFEADVDVNPARAGAHGFDTVEFVVAANPGTPLQPLMKVASGGELARFMLALKVVLAARGSAPCLVFDEIDTGVGGAVAEAIGLRLSRLAQGLQVLAVTHSPQVAARATRHMQISKVESGDGSRMATRIADLDGAGRREEIARMLSGAEITAEARAQAGRLIAGTS